MLHSKTPSCSILSRVKNKCLTLDSLTRKMYPGLARLLTSGRLHFHLHCLSAEKVAFPSDCFCAFLISSEAGSCHSELPSLMGYIFFLSIHYCCFRTPSPVESIVALVKLSSQGCYLAWAPSLHLRGCIHIVVHFWILAEQDIVTVSFKTSFFFSCFFVFGGFEMAAPF